MTNHIPGVDPNNSRNIDLLEGYEPLKTNRTDGESID
jgi:hypothetical protein